MALVDSGGVVGQGRALGMSRPRLAASRGERVLSGRDERATDEGQRAPEPPLGDGGPSESRLRGTGEPPVRPGHAQSPALPHDATGVHGGQAR
jgi:hypothetical protein